MPFEARASAYFNPFGLGLDPRDEKLLVFRSGLPSIARNIKAQL